jgi:hypothetical protein
VIGRPDLVAPEHDGAQGQPEAVVVHSGETLTATERDRLQRHLDRARKAGLTRVLRLHTLARGKVPPTWADLDVDRVDEADGSSEWLSQCCVLLAVRSTAAVDALWRGVPTAVLADPSRSLPCELEYLAENQSNLTSNTLRGDQQAQDREIVFPFTGIAARDRLAQVLESILLEHKPPSL